MKYETSNYQSVLIFRLSGVLRGSPDSYRFLDAVRGKLERRTQLKILIDLKGVTGIDSAGVGILASIVTAAELSGASLVFSNIAKHVAKPIAVVRLMRVLDVVPTIDNALEHFAGQAVVGVL